MPTYKAKVKEYITNQGDIWDIVALVCYGDERCCHHVQDANYDHRDVDGFPANIILVIPQEVTIENNLKRTVGIKNLGQLLPWR
jgi:hypothetical protein